MLGMPSMTKEQLIKKYQIQNQIFTVAGFILAFIGIVVFISFYQKYIDGDVMNFIRRPYLVAIMIIPFFPALILLLLAKKAEKNAVNIQINGIAGDTAKPKKRA